jgi:hypothetical protein
MSDLQRRSDTRAPAQTGAPGLFAVPPPEPPRRGMMLGVAGGVALIAIIAISFWLHGNRNVAVVAQNTVLPSDPYAQNLALTQLAMSQSTSLSGGTSTFIDGHVRNSGTQTITGATIQVIFRNDVGLSPQVETLPLTLIRTHEPYVDTEPVSAAPLKPGVEVEFRSIIETLPANWNQQMPEIHVVHVRQR